MKITSVISLSLAAVWVLLTILQIWFLPLAIDIYVKLSITLGLIVIITVVIGLVAKEYLSEKKMKDQGYID